MTPAGLYDYHLHTTGTVDAHGDVTAYCARARELGLREIAFTSHFMLDWPDYTISHAELGHQAALIDQLAPQYPGMALKLALEVDYFPGQEHRVAAELERYQDAIGRPLDLVWGATHHLLGVFVSNRGAAPAIFAAHDLRTIYRAWFVQLAEAAVSGLFDAMVHPDMVKKHSGMLAPYLPFAEYAEEAAQFVAAAVASGVVLEINTAGLRLPVQELQPSDNLLALYAAESARQGRPPRLLMGSDAHLIDHVGYRLDEAAAAARRAGACELVGFTARQPHSLPLPVA